MVVVAVGTKNNLNSSRPRAGVRGVCDRARSTSMIVGESGLNVWRVFSMWIWKSIASLAQSSLTGQREEWVGFVIITVWSQSVLDSPCLPLYFRWWWWPDERVVCGARSASQRRWEPISVSTQNEMLSNFHRRRPRPRRSSITRSTWPSSNHQGAASAKWFIVAEKLSSPSPSSYLGTYRLDNSLLIFIRGQVEFDLEPTATEKTWTVQAEV